MRRCLLLTAVLGLAGCYNGILLRPVSVGCPVEETLIRPADCCLCRSRIALIDVEGLIVNARAGGLLDEGENPVSVFRERLDAAAADPRVKAVVLRLNSPGGGVTASEMMHHDLMEFRRKTGKPVVACMMDVAASGAFYLAMACDRVYAHPSTVTGSIGVIMSLYNASGLLGWIGVKSDPIKSGPNKDLANPARPMSPEERAILQGMVNSFYDQFVHVVVEGRHLPETKVRELADGRVYTGAEAARLGLVDEVGYLDDALEAAKALACLKDAKVVAYDRCEGYRGSIYAALPRLPETVRVKLDVPGMPGHGAAFLYVWDAGMPR
jgi:protease IV